MFSGLICTVACGVGLAFDELANPAHPLSPVEPHASIPNSPASADLLLAVALNFCPAFPRARFGLAISFPSGFLVREADYGFDPCNKYCGDVHLKYSPSPLPLTLTPTPTLPTD